MRAIDGTFWRVYDCDYDGIVRDTKDFATKAAAKKYCKDRYFAHVGKKRRPRMSIVRAVKLITEARKQGVELWMRPANRVTYGWLHLFGSDTRALSHTDNGIHGSMIPELLEDKWIVATPEDARKIDAKATQATARSRRA